MYGVYQKNSDGSFHFNDFNLRASGNTGDLDSCGRFFSLFLVDTTGDCGGDDNDDDVTCVDKVSCCCTVDHTLGLVTDSAAYGTILGPAGMPSPQPMQNYSYYQQH